MNIVVTGSLGNISRPLIIELIKVGNKVTVISSSNQKKQEIEMSLFEKLTKKCEQMFEVEKPDADNICAVFRIRVPTIRPNV